ncbi:MAG TPA: endo-1,4-beta-xylanase, partial [Chitinophagaceae bacterium]|nr:endo-1,4-beta-xylanase [Chitinophagaceae bacterium]
KPAPLKPELSALNPTNIFPVGADTNHFFRDQSKGERPASFTVQNPEDSEPVFTAEVFSAASSHYSIQSTWKSAAPVKKGDVLLARFSIRSIYAKQESGEAVIYFFVQQAMPPNEKSVIIDISAGPEWKTIDIPFVALNDMMPGEASIVISYGALAQKVEITAIQVLNFGQKASLSQLPKTRFTYRGRERDAAWRKKALQRIDSIRTAPLLIQVMDSKGSPVKGATVAARLVDPEFAFGTAVSADLIYNNDSTSVIYKRLLGELFNTVTIDNNLKWPVWMDPAKRAKTKVAMQWINDNGFRLRGHNLVWPGKKFTPSFYSRQPSFGPSFADSITKHIEDIATYTKGRVFAWDVINEMMHEKEYFEVMPRSKAVEWFKQARRIDPSALLFINEYGMLNSISSPKNIETYLELIGELRHGGAPIDAIGVQGHVGRQPRNPEQVLTDLDLFTATGLPVQITEFDINSPDEELQADYTRDFLIACYSHPIVTGFTMWGFWQGAHWKPDAAMFRKDWTPKPNAAAWRDLVTKEWRTSLAQTSDGKGQVDARGHLGRYEITVTKNNTTKTVFHQLTKKATTVNITL